MARVTVQLPSLLEASAGGQRSIDLEAEDFAGALRRLVELHPPLESLLFDEGGAFRQHVLCFHNEVNSRWRPDHKAPLANGDRIMIIQAVSGG